MVAEDIPLPFTVLSLLGSSCSPSEADSGVAHRAEIQASVRGLSSDSCPAWTDTEGNFRHTVGSALYVQVYQKGGWRLLWNNIR